jgi:hypothetical protein
MACPGHHQQSKGAKSQPGIVIHTDAVTSRGDQSSSRIVNDCRGVRNSGHLTTEVLAKAMTWLMTGGPCDCSLPYGEMFDV